MLDTAKNVMNRVGCATADLARKVGDETTYLARRIGPKRAIIGFAIMGAAVGGTIFLVRFFRNRQDIVEELPETGERLSKKARKRMAKRGNAHASTSPMSP